MRRRPACVSGHGHRRRGSSSWRFASTAVSREKAEAIKAQDFERAAGLRDEEAGLRGQLEAARASWRREQDTGALTVEPDDIAEVVTQWTGIPVSRLLEGEGERLLAAGGYAPGARNRAGRGCHGAVPRHPAGRMGLKDPRRPIGSFIFSGRAASARPSCPARRRGFVRQ